ncbi:MAG: hypothetical protein IT374_03750 [Polyangiaceae bacterium]|nr:hypothetical protein [Polyangiaceae bacterium]
MPGAPACARARREGGHPPPTTTGDGDGSPYWRSAERRKKALGGAEDA